jgi:hypothetical protein
VTYHLLDTRLGNRTCYEDRYQASDATFHLDLAQGRRRV